VYSELSNYKLRFGVNQFHATSRKCTAIGWPVASLGEHTVYEELISVRVGTNFNDL